MTQNRGMQRCGGGEVLGPINVNSRLPLIPNVMALIDDALWIPTT